MQIEQLTPALRDDRQLARECLVHENAERVDVRLRDDVRADALLRRHVLGRTQRVARLRERLGSRELAHAAVEDLRRAVVAEEDVAGLEITMDDPFLVRSRERPAHADEDGDRKPRRDDVLARELVGEGAAVQTLHDDVHRSVGHLIEVVHATDVDVIDVDLDVRLATEARDLAAVASGGAAQDLHRDLVPERRVLGRVDDADAAGADLLADAVLASEHRAGELAGVGGARRLAAKVEAALERRDPVLLEGTPCGLHLRAIPHRAGAGAESAGDHRTDRSGDPSTRHPDGGAGQDRGGRGRKHGRALGRGQLPLDEVGAALVALREARLVGDASVGEAPDARDGGELSLTRCAEERLALEVGVVLVVAVVARAVDEANRTDRGLVLREPLRRVGLLGIALVGLVLEAAGLSRGLRGSELEVPRTDTRDLTRIVGEVDVSVDRLLRRTEHAHVSTERLGVRDPFTSTAKRIDAAELLADPSQRLSSGERAHPARLVVDHRRIDARVREDRPNGAITLLATDAEQVRLEERRAKLLFTALTHGALRQLRRALHPKMRLYEQPTLEKPAPREPSSSEEGVSSEDLDRSSCEVSVWIALAPGRAPQTFVTTSTLGVADARPRSSSSIPPGPAPKTRPSATRPSRMSFSSTAWT